MPITYDPSQNVVLKRNPLVIQKKLWDTWSTVNQLERECITQIIKQTQSSIQNLVDKASTLKGTNPVTQESELQRLLKSQTNLQQMQLEKQ